MATTCWTCGEPVGEDKVDTGWRVHCKACDDLEKENQP